MRIASLLSALCAATIVSAVERTTEIWIQPVEAVQKPSVLAEVSYDLAALSASSVTSYEAPDLPDDTKTVRIGIFDKKSKQWVSGSTVASVDNFKKGYSPNFLLSVDSKGEVVSAAIKGIKVDAGYTRDFGPKVVVLPEIKGKQPELNKPVVLSPEGKREEVQEKSFIQKCVTMFPSLMQLIQKLTYYFTGIGGLLLSERSLFWLLEVKANRRSICNRFVLFYAKISVYSKAHL